MSEAHRRNHCGSCPYREGVFCGYCRAVGSIAGAPPQQEPPPMRRIVDGDMIIEGPDAPER